ncbi:MAG: septal ring lytic transglycosylase RlpA family protein [Gammaproteobacteria bacterium]
MVRRDSKGFRYYLRVNTALAICLAFALFLHGCASLTKHEPHPGLTGYKETGMASYYANKFHHRKTASGERFDNNAMTAAHKTLPFGTEVKVTNLNNGESVTIRINDRGPFVKGRIIDLSRAAFSQIADLNRGVAKVEIRVVK